MQRLVLLLALMFLLTPSDNGQSVKPKPIDDDTVAVEKLWLLSDLQSLEGKSQKLDTLLASALAKASMQYLQSRLIKLGPRSCYVNPTI